MLRVEGLARGAERLQAQALDAAAQLLRDGGERALAEVAVLLSPVEIVEHRQQHLDDVADGALPLDLAVRLGALAVVRVLGGDPLQVGEPLCGEIV